MNVFNGIFHKGDVEMIAGDHLKPQQDVKENRKSYNVFLRSPFVWLAILVFGYAAYTLLSGSFSRTVFRTPPAKKSQEVALEKKQEKTETRQEVQNVEVKKDVCISRMATVHGEKRFYLSNNTFVTVPDGLGFCP